MERIIIAISKLSRDNWRTIYKFIKSIVTDASIDTKKSALESLQSISNGIRFKSNENPATAKDVYSLYGMEISDNSLIAFEKNTCFSILYQKENDSEDFTELVPFILIQQEFGNNVTLGIDICELNDNQRNSYKFKCSDFFILHDEQKPTLGYKSIYFIERTIDKQTGELGKQYTISLAGKGKSGDTKYQGNISRRFLPLIHITEDNYESLFSYKKDRVSKESYFVSGGIAKIEGELKKTNSPELSMIFDSDNLFGLWFEAGYFYSYDKDELERINYQIAGMRSTLQIFKESVQELVQNILFHGGKKGLLYCVFDKKNNISDSYGRLIPDFNNYDDNIRFLRIGVFDFSENGIVDTFCANENVVLKDFFDLNNNVTTELTQLDMRYAARLGIKTFVKTIEDHKGYFRVESCEHHNGMKTKKFISTILSEEGYRLNEEKNVDFVNGTHYEIILPVVGKTNSSIPVQSTSISKDFTQLFDSDCTLRAVKIKDTDFEKISNSKDKQEQVKEIKNVCDIIIKNIGNDKKEIAIDLGHHKIPSTIFFKIAAFLQLTLKSPLEKLILVNVTNEFNTDFYSLIDKTIVKQSNKDIPVWSRDCAIILLSSNLHANIVWGKTKDELYFINREYKKLYYSNFLDTEKYRDFFDKNFDTIDDKCREAAKRFVLPYDMLINLEDKENKDATTSLFKEFLKQLLKKEIVSKEPGLLVNHKYTYIGKKIIVKNFYEADTLFQNNFFVERFAFYIVRDLKIHLLLENVSGRQKTLVLIGYKYYSEFLLKTIKRQMGTYPISLVICNDEKNSSETDCTFNFGIDDNSEKTKENILADPDSFLFATIVPIGATLSTNDKIISFFERWIKNGNASTSKPVFFYNHCAIVVRDIIGETPTHLEKEQKWVEVNLTENNIVTRYQNAKTIHFIIQLANKDNPADNNWIKRLNNSISFPKEWKNEKYVNHTENSSINSQNFMDFPEIYTYNENEEEHLEHIYELKDFIYKGHIEILNCHHKFYVSTEDFVRQKSNLVGKWLENLKSKVLTNMETLNVLVTPNVERESDFVRMVNDKVFDGNALIIYLDLSNWRSNISKKLSFLENIGVAQYHYVDHAFLTGSTYFKSRTILNSIVKKDDFRFSSAFTIINRLPYPKEKDIREELRGNLFAYANLYYPTSKADGQECELCQLEKYYEELERKTVLDSCAEIINKNKRKLKLTNLEETKKELKENKRDSEWKRRVFLRMITTHWLYYKISTIASSYKDFETKKNKVVKKLDDIYSSLCGVDKTTSCLLNQKIGQWFVGNIFFDEEDKLLALDKKLSFLKAISSPPLSQYIAIREYAHDKLLEELYNTVYLQKTFNKDDLKIVKSILKSLSFLKSNALVRKGVIVGVWKVLLNVISHLDEDTRKSTIQDFSKDVQFYIKNAIVEDEAKATFLGELLRQGEEILDIDELKISKTQLSLTNRKNNNPTTITNDLFNKFNDCDAVFRQEYTSFLVWLFYDNTTIIRNTLINFSKELEKDHKLHDKFYDGDNLKHIDEFKKHFNDIKSYFDRKIIGIKDNVRLNDKEKDEGEYYYSSFKPYIENGDGIRFVEKLVFVTYAKLKLEDLINKKHKTNIEVDTRELMEIFASIMGANAAFWTMKKNINDTSDYLLYPISVYSGNSDKLSGGWKYDLWNLKNEFFKYYTTKFYESSKGIKDPLTPLYDMNKNTGEERDLGMRSLGVFVISNLEESENRREKTNTPNNNAVASITFLYDKNNTLTQSEKIFRVNFQESSRLLKLLKNEIDLYVIDYLIKEKAFDIWEEKFKSIRKFEKIYAKQSHVFKSVYKEMDEFDGLKEEEIIRMLYKTWFFLTNETISFLYSNIEKSLSVDGRHCLSLMPEYIIDTNNTIGETFSTNFISFLRALLDYRWNEVMNNRIIINGRKIENFKLKKSLQECIIPCNKHLIRTLIVQLLNNSLASENGHRNEYDEKIVYIRITESSIVIKDLDCTLKKAEKSKMIRSFNQKKKYIKNMRCDEYSSTTLTTLQGVMDYMKKEKINFSCEYGFCNDSNFEVAIYF